MKKLFTIITLIVILMVANMANAKFSDDIMEWLGDDVPRFCPDCGADMRSEKIRKAEMFECPKWLDNESKREWKRIVHSTPSADMRKMDLATLATSCQAVSRNKEIKHIADTYSKMIESLANNLGILKEEDSENNEE